MAMAYMNVSARLWSTFKNINIAGSLADPPDDILKEKLLLYAMRGYSVAEKLSRLECDLQLFIKYSH